MPSSFIVSDEWDAGRVIRIGPVTSPDPGAGSGTRMPQPVHESLHGKTSWPRLTARRCHATFVAKGSPNEPRYSLRSYERRQPLRSFASIEPASASTRREALRT
jgi:hypothetical protein